MWIKMHSTGQHLETADLKDKTEKSYTALLNSYSPDCSVYLNFNI